MLLITKLLFFPFSSNFSSLKAKSPFLSYASPLDSLSVEQKSLFMFPKILRLFSVPPGGGSLSLCRRLSFETFPLRPKAAQFSWVLFIPRDKGRERREIVVD